MAANIYVQTPIPTGDSSLVKLAISLPGAQMQKAMQNFESQNVKILKKAGEAANSEVVARFLGCEVPEKGFDKGFWEAVVAVPFLEDPDGYMIEMIPY